MENFVKAIPTNIRHVIEFCHSSWFGNTLYNLLNKHNAGFVINDSSRFAAQTAVTADCVYIRLLGPKALYSPPYKDIELIDWSEKISIWLKTKDVYCYFNIDFGGHAFRNAQTL